MGKYFITPEQLWSAVGGAEAPVILDTRRRKVFEDEDWVIPGAVWTDHTHAVAQAPKFGGDVVVYCRQGHQNSQSAAAMLRAAGVQARVLRGGIAAWREASLPMLKRTAFPQISPDTPSRWITRRRPKIDRIACPWLVKRFIDPRAEFFYVDPDQVFNAAQEMGAIPFDIEGAELSHEGEFCTFDVILRQSGIEDPALDTLAVIIRGADTARLELAPECAGLLAMTIGISALAGEDDRIALVNGMALYDALYAWLRKAPDETHNWPAGAPS